MKQAIVIFALLLACHAHADVRERLHCNVTSVEFRITDGPATAHPDGSLVGAEFYVTLPEGTFSGDLFSPVADVPALRQDSNYFDKYSIAVEMDDTAGLMELLRRELPSGWTFSVKFEAWVLLGRCEGGPAF